MSDSSDPARALLVILDGWGLREPSPDNAVTEANAPTWRRLWESGEFPRAQLTTHGPAVGLPEGQMGNSEVGHLNLGAGRVVMQSLLRIGQAIESGKLAENPTLQSLFDGVRQRGGTLHLLGLVGTGGVHAENSHLLALCRLAEQQRLAHVRLHAFLDGRDTPPQSGHGFLSELAASGVGPGHCRLATLTGRFYAMDRDRRWDRTELAYRALVHGEGEAITDPLEALSRAYANGETDEFVKPRVVVGEQGEPLGRIRDGDAVLFFNFRADRARQLSRALADESFGDFERGERPEVQVATLTEYDAELPLPTLFPPQPMTNLLADVLAAAGRRSFRTAETEKYPHVTYFFNGGSEQPPRGEDRRLVPSPKVATYDLQPEMSAAGVTDGLVEALDSQQYDLLVCNYANPDMVGHTGVLAAAIRAVETVDACLGRVVEACERTGTTLLVLADHGNCEQMWDPTTNGPHTAHTTNPVGVVLVEPRAQRTTTNLADGALCDVAPTLLGILGLAQPAEMTGRDLRTSGNAG